MKSCLWAECVSLSLILAESGIVAARDTVAPDEADTTAARRLSVTPRRLLLLTSFTAAAADDEASSLLSAEPASSSALTQNKAPFASLWDVLYFIRDDDGEAVASC